MKKKLQSWKYIVNEYAVKVTLVDYSFAFTITDANGNKVRQGGGYDWGQFQSAVFDTCIKPTEVETASFVEITTE